MGGLGLSHPPGWQSGHPDWPDSRSLSAVPAHQALSGLGISGLIIPRSPTQKKTTSVPGMDFYRLWAEIKRFLALLAALKEPIAEAYPHPQDRLSGSFIHSFPHSFNHWDKRSTCQHPFQSSVSPDYGPDSEGDGPGLERWELMGHKGTGPRASGAEFLSIVLASGTPASSGTWAAPHPCALSGQHMADERVAGKFTEVGWHLSWDPKYG